VGNNGNVELGNNDGVDSPAPSLTIMSRRWW
jgi:hypothetical protein